MNEGIFSQNLKTVNGGGDHPIHMGCLTEDIRYVRLTKIIKTE